MKQRIRLSDHFTYGRLLRFVYPSVIMLVFTSIYGVVDGFFVSNMAGKTAFAALNLIMPFLMILGGMGFMIGTGGSALVAAEYGAGERKLANEHFSMLTVFTILLGVFLAAVGILVMRPVALLLGADEEMVEYCVLYGDLVALFFPVFMLQNVFQNFLAMAEKPKMGLWITVAAGVTNGILDGIFIGVYGWGLAGAALATGIGQCVGGILPLVYFLRPNGSLLRLRKVRLSAKPLLRACGNGFSELMSNISHSVIGMVYNAVLMRMLGQNGVSAYGVLMYVNFIFVAISIGYSVGSAPVVSYHYGAGNRGELKSLLRKSTVLNLVVGVLLMLLAIRAAAPMARLFVGYDPELLSLTIRALKISAVPFLLVGFNIFSSGFFTALNNGVVSAVISFLRTLVFQTAAVLLLPMVLGEDGIWWAMTAANLVAFALSWIFLWGNRKKYGYF